MNDYLKNLQEATVLTESFRRVRTPITEEEMDKFIDEMNNMEEPLESLDEDAMAALSALGAGVVTFGMITAAVYAAIKLQAQNPQCEKYNSTYKIKCNRIMNLRKRAVELRSKMVMCQNARYIDVCKEGVKKEIDEIAKRIKAAGSIEGASGTKGTGIPSGKKPEALKNPKERKISISFKHKKK